MSQPNIELEEKQNCLDIWGTLLEQETINQSNISTAESPKALVDFLHCKLQLQLEKTTSIWTNMYQIANQPTIKKLVMLTI